MFMFRGCRKRQVIKRLLKLARERLESESPLGNRESERCHDGQEEAEEETVLSGLNSDQLLSRERTNLGEESPNSASINRNDKVLSRSTNEKYYYS